jgi:hypothetical protein
MRGRETRNDRVSSDPGHGAEFLMYPSDDGQTCISVRVAEETVWLSQRNRSGDPRLNSYRDIAVY